MSSKKLFAGPLNHLSQCRHGYMLYNANDHYIGRSLDLYGEFSEGEAHLFGQLVHPGDIVLDVGANIGAHTIVFAKLVGPTGLVYAFEPQRVVFQLLCANVALNSLTNVHSQQVAVGDRPGTMALPPLNYEMRANFGGVSPRKSRQGETVPLVTIDKLALPACRLIKADVEGAEVGVLKGARRTIERYKPVLYVENDRVDKSVALMTFIEQLGYQMFWHRPALYNPQNFAGNSKNEFGKIVSKNLLCTHPDVKTIVIKGFEPAVVGKPPS